MVLLRNLKLSNMREDASKGTWLIINHLIHSECPLVTHLLLLSIVHKLVHHSHPHEHELLCLNAGITTGTSPITDNDNNMMNRLSSLIRY